MALGVPMARRCPDQPKRDYAPAVGAIAAQSPMLASNTIGALRGQAGYQNALRQAKAAGAKIRTSGGSSMGRSGSAGYSSSSSRSLGGRGLY